MVIVYALFEMRKILFIINNANIFSSEYLFFYLLSSEMAEEQKNKKDFEALEYIFLGVTSYSSV